MAKRQDATVGTRVLLARLEHAITRVESASTIALTVLATGATYILSTIDVIPLWTWPTVFIFGLVAEAVLVFMSFFDHTAGTEKVASSLQNYFGIQTLRTPAIKVQMAQAIQYRIDMENVIAKHGRGVRERLINTLREIDTWISGIGRLAIQLDKIYSEKAAQNARKQQIEDRISSLKIQKGTVADDDVRQELEATMNSLSEQIRLFEKFENILDQGELRLERAVGALGAVHTQIAINAAQGTGSVRPVEGEQVIGEEIENISRDVETINQNLGTAVDTAYAENLLQRPELKWGRNKE